MNGVNAAGECQSCEKGAECRQADRHGISFAAKKRSAQRHKEKDALNHEEQTHHFEQHGKIEERRT